MINKDNFKALLRHLKFKEKGDIFNKDFEESGVYLKVDFKKEKLDYPELVGLKINERQTCNFASAENVVVFECVYQLLNKGYKPKHIELEPKWKLGHGASGGRADILVKNQKDKPLLIIECKTYGKEFNKAWKDTQEDGGQLFSYAQQISETDFLCLYASEFDEKNSQILTEQRIISHKDNEKILEQGDELKSFKKASNVKKRFDVWKETYQLEYTETGIFESNIRKYEIGKSNYTLDIDTRPVRNEDKDGKYHRFRTILRQHNIARKETAFEVLVNLFLAKIVDEEENKTNLEFYWKGVAYDNYYDFIDRLQKLYQIGMRKFLKDEVMYISNDQIDSAFWTVKNKRNATKKQIQKYFRDLKFFSNNAFSLINVHNERLFNRNTKVLVELVQMWQGLRLKTKEQNQFLGDMFEYFLDNSIKQSEGQFFTPMPITKFIVASLPLEDKIQKASEPLRTIDYACGSGHFLTEYAHQIKPLVEKYKETEVSKYYENIIGIEKEDRLAKIAKVSAYMYGQDQINILEKDALSSIEEVKNESFDILVANPPFAVEGFLLNLDDKQKQLYKLIETTELNSNTNNIQCFFIERAKQIMKPSGVVGVIVPSSILSNSDATHIGTREIILKYFDIVSIVELGSGTFGKTGTNTVVLYLKRKSQKPEPAEHYANRVEDYFEGIKEDDKSTSEYQDLYLIKKYCEHTEIPFEEYKKLFGITADTMANLDELFKNEMFADYKNDFENSTEIINYKKKKVYKDKTTEEKELELSKRLIKYIYKVEKNKLFYFMLAFENKQKVLIVKSPSNNKEQKKFLGYEWSGAKGSEGIKYTGGNNLNDIITPLFNPTNVNDKSKINYLIQQNFLGAKPNDLTEFEKHKDLITYVNVTDILDFSRKDFNKEFSLSPKKNITIDTKWELVKLESIMTIIRGASPRPISDFVTSDKNSVNWIKIGDVEAGSKYITKTEEKITKEGALKSREVKSGDFILSNSMSFGRPYILKINGCVHDGWLILTDFNKELKKDYLYEILSSDTTQQQFTENAGGGVVENLNIDRVKPVKIPLPPKTVQVQIVKECEIIDKASEKAQQSIDKTKADIEKEFKEILSKANKIFRLNNSEIFEVSIGKRVVAKEIEDTEIGIPVYSANVFEPFGFINKELLKDFDKPTVLWGIDGDWIVNYIEKENPFYPTDHCGVLRVKGKEIHPRYLTFVLDKAGQEVRFSRNHRASIDRIKGLSIKAPSFAIQKQFTEKVEKLEKKISEAKLIIESATEKKQKVMDKYLK
ncbi:MAG: type I restriction endonuclease subunit M [Bacteroidetes bacterium]|nr:MAG: type I restriction endonuclease subunit M [Bacteroidota bacterium]